MRILKSHPLLRLMNSYLIDSPQPSNLNYWWNVGSLLGLCLVIQIVTGVTLAMDCLSMLKTSFVEYLWNIVYIIDLNLNSIIKLLFFENKNKAISNEDLKNIIKNMKYNKSVSFGQDKEFYEWLRGFVDAEGYFLIHPVRSQKLINSQGNLVISRSLVFSFIIHLPLKELGVLEIIRKRLGGIGKINQNKEVVTLKVSTREDLEKLLSIMFDYLKKLNTTKILDFLAWNEARIMYYGALDKINKNIPKDKDASFNAIFDKIIAIKNSCNKSRTDFTLPADHKVSITKYWFLGFVEGEGCFYAQPQSIIFTLAQSGCNYYVLVAIKDFLLKITRTDYITISDCKPNKFKQKPYSVLRIEKNKGCATTLIPLLINLNWFSLKRSDFIRWVIIYLLIVEGKHYTSKGKDIIYKLRKGMNLYRSDNYQNISQEIIDLLDSPSNSVLTEESIVKLVEHPTYPFERREFKLKHVLDSYVLVTNPENSISFCLRTSAACAEYFTVSKTTVARWIAKNSPVFTKKGIFIFKKIKKED